MFSWPVSRRHGFSASSDNATKEFNATRSRVFPLNRHPKRTHAFGLFSDCAKCLEKKFQRYRTADFRVTNFMTIVRTGGPVLLGSQFAVAKQDRTAKPRRCLSYGFRAGNPGSSNCSNSCTSEIGFDGFGSRWGITERSPNGVSICFQNFHLHPHRRTPMRWNASPAAERCSGWTSSPNNRDHEPPARRIKWQSICSTFATKLLRSRREDGGLEASPPPTNPINKNRAQNHERINIPSKL